VSEEVNRKLLVVNMMVQLGTLYTDPECYNTQSHRQRDDIVVSIADPGTG